MAAFGLLDSIDQFETAQVYIALATRKLNKDAEAVAAIQRLLAAERIRHRYSSLNLPDAVRADFERVGAAVLTPDQLTQLRMSATAPKSAGPAAPQPRMVEVPVPGTVIVTPPVTRATPAGRKPRETRPPVSQPARPSQVAAGTASPAADPPGAATGVSTTNRGTSSSAVGRSGADPIQKPAQSATRQTPAPPPSPAPQLAQPLPRTPAPLPPEKSAQRLAQADRAINDGDLARARSLYRDALDAPQLGHESALRVAEGLYRARDFPNAVRAFERAGRLTAGEEPYHYYHAVALYETGNYPEAKRELAAAIPYIEITPDIERYRAKIEGSID